MLIIRGILGGIFQLAIIGSMLIVPAGLAAGEWEWVRGWQFVVCYGLVMMTVIVAMAVFAPNSLEARLKPPSSEKQPFKDKIATFFVLLAITLYFIFIPLDVFIWQVFGPPPQMISVLGAVLCASGYALITWTIFANSFAIPIVEDQSDQGQILIDTTVKYQFEKGEWDNTFYTIMGGTKIEQKLPEFYLDALKMADTFLV